MNIPRVFVCDRSRKRDAASVGGELARCLSTSGKAVENCRYIGKTAQNIVNIAVRVAVVYDDGHACRSRKLKLRDEIFLLLLAVDPVIVIIKTDLADRAHGGIGKQSFNFCNCRICTFLNEGTVVRMYPGCSEYKRELPRESNAFKGCLLYTSSCV